MNNERNENCEPLGKHEYLLSKYHDCTKHIGRGCRALEGALKGLNQPLAYANKWVHHEDSDRVDVLFYDMLQSRNRWISVPISVPISVFDSGEWDEFATRYCRVGEVENGA